MNFLPLTLAVKIAYKYRYISGNVKFLPLESSDFSYLSFAFLTNLCCREKIVILLLNLASVHFSYVPELIGGNYIL